MTIDRHVLPILLLGLLLIAPGSGKAANITKKKPLRDLGRAAEITLRDAAYVYTAPTRLNRRSALWLGGILATGSLIYAYDQEIYDALKRNEFDDLYRPIRDTGEFFEPVGFQGFTNQYIIGGLVLGYVTGVDPLVDVTSDMLECIIIGGGVKRLTMIAVGRKGPSQEEGPRSFDFADGRSFPSGHSLTVVQLMSVLSHHVESKPFSVVAYTIAGSVLLQRITSDAHWPSDVFAGATLGWFNSRAILGRKGERNMTVIPTTLGDVGGFGLVFRVRF